MLVNLSGDIDGNPIPNCPRCKGSGKPHQTDRPQIKKCMCILHYYVCPTIKSAGNEDVHTIILDRCDCMDMLKKIM